MTNEQLSSNTLPFSTIPLSPQLARAVEEMNYTTATDIQASAIPFLLDGKDLIGHSSTGTGKTAAFGIPAVESVDGLLKKPQVLVLSPTRELALQISREMQKYAKYKEGICIATVYGGASMSDQIRLLKRANVVVGTPGRLMDHLRRRTLKMDDLKMLILDEADEMLSMGFIDDIKTILSHAPEKRQTALFSATMPPPILKISKDFLCDPKIVDVMLNQDSKANIEQTYYDIPHSKKIDTLKMLLQYADTERSIVFCNTKNMVDELSACLAKEGFKASGLHGDMSQAARTQIMNGFRTGIIHILVATDVAARGIDVDNVDMVVNYDLPQSFEYYIHRIGRTGRAGKKGLSQTLVCNRQQLSTLKSLMNFTGIAIKECSLPTGPQIMEQAVAKQVEKLMPQLQEKPGNAARLLVKQLMENGDDGLSGEEVACILAEKLMGGDEKFQNNVVPNDNKMRKGFEKRDRKSGERQSTVVVSANIGKRSKVTPNHIVGAIAELLDIPGKNIGKIDIMPEQTYIGLREDDAQDLVGYKRPIHINGQNVTFSINRKKTTFQSQSSVAFKKRSKNYKRLA